VHDVVDVPVTGWHLLRALRVCSQVDALSAALRASRATIERAAAVTAGASKVLRHRAFSTLNVDDTASDPKAALRAVVSAGTMPASLVAGDVLSSTSIRAGAGAGSVSTVAASVASHASPTSVEPAGEEVVTGLRSPSPSRSAVKAGRAAGLRRRSTRSAAHTRATDVSGDADLELGGGGGGGRSSVPTETPQILKKIKGRGGK